MGKNMLSGFIDSRFLTVWVWAAAAEQLDGVWTAKSLRHHDGPFGRLRISHARSFCWQAAHTRIYFTVLNSEFTKMCATLKGARCRFQIGKRTSFGTSPNGSRERPPAELR